MTRRILAVALGTLLLVSCVSTQTDNAGTNQHNAQQEALNRARENVTYVDRNHVELDNYNKRQALADDPTTLLWCTSSFPQPNSPMFTVPVVGKLTSGGKRPYPTTISRTYYQSTSEYFPELPGADGMYGTSGEYRYGFTPAGFYVDFYNIATFCTTELTVFQRESTIVMLAQDNSIAEAQGKAQAALKAGDTAKATQILLDALKVKK
jgi:hypothetical protein